MATASQPQRPAATTSPNGERPLERVLEQTTRQQSLTADAARFLGVKADKLFGYLRNVWKTSKGQAPLTDEEMGVGIGLIARYELDPIAREVYVTRGKGGLFAIVGIDGWLKVLDRTDHYDGFTVEIHHDEQGAIDWVETKIHSTKRTHPAVYRAYAAEYARIAGMVARDLPSHMLRIFSLKHAARLFVPLSSCIATEEEVAYVERQQDARQAKTATLDDLTDRLSRPIEQVAETPPPAAELPETSYEPPAKQEPQQPDTANAWQKFEYDLAAAATISDSQLVYDHWFSPSSAIPWTDEQHAEAAQLKDLRQASIREARGTRSNRKE